MNRTLKIVLWNAIGLIKHQLELQAVLDIDNAKACLVLETQYT